MHCQAAQEYDSHFLDHNRELELIWMDQQRKVRPIADYVVRHHRQHPARLPRRASKFNAAKLETLAVQSRPMNLFWAVGD